MELSTDLLSLSRFTIIKYINHTAVWKISREFYQSLELTFFKSAMTDDSASARLDRKTGDKSTSLSQVKWNKVKPRVQIYTISVMVDGVW